MNTMPAILSTAIFLLCCSLVMCKALCGLNYMNRKTPWWIRFTYSIIATIGFSGLLIQAQPHWWAAVLALVLTLFFIHWDSLHGHNDWEKLKRGHRS